MHSFNRIFALAIVFVVSWTELVHAHSAAARPLKRLAQPTTLALEILPRQKLITRDLHRIPNANPRILRHDDSFRLIISAFDEKFYLHLRPNDELIHPAARVNYYSTTSDGRSVITHSEPLLRESIRAYWGEVIEEYHSPTRMREDASKAAPRPHPAVLGWARIMVHNQGHTDLGMAPEFEGAFSVAGDVYHIMTKDNYVRNKDPLDPDVSQALEGDSELIIWRESDVMSAHEEYSARTGRLLDQPPPARHACGHDRLPYNTDPELNTALQKTIAPKSWYNPFSALGNSSLIPRQDVIGDDMGTNFIDDIGSTAGCPKAQKVLFMGVAADCTYVQRYGSQENATKQILTNWNSASTLYKTNFNVSLGIVELQVQQAGCPSSAPTDFPWNVDCAGVELDARLSIFSKWRGDKGDDGVGLWHLMSGCPTGSEVGIAWLATLCQQTTTGEAPNFVSGTAVSTAGRTEWQVVAHEIGHNFGAIHDCADGCSLNDACCPLSTTSCDATSQFIMSPVAQPGEKMFSQCTIGNICSLMAGSAGGKVDTSCLADPGPNLPTLGLEMCGNGIVEGDEECDPGKGVESPCCNSATCKFNNGAVCDPRSSPCCTDQCTFAPPTQVCRPSIDTRCDTAEMCTGNTSSCPTDVTVPNGQSCGDGDLRCASGQCTSVAQQCRTVGASMGLQDACPNRGDNSCQVSCQDPTRANSCILLTSLLIDGSPCGFGGSCVSGKCESADFLDTAKAWYTQNLQIAIPVTVVAGLVVLLLLWALFSSLRRCCTKRKRSIPDPALRPMGIRPPQQNVPRGYESSPGVRTPGLPSVLQPTSASYSRLGDNSHSNWVDESAYNGPRRQ